MTIEKHILPQTGLVRIPTILAHVQIGKSTWWKRVKEGKAPSPIRLGKRTTCWRAEDIHSFIKEYSNKTNEAGNEQ